MSQTDPRREHEAPPALGHHLLVGLPAVVALLAMTTVIAVPYWTADYAAVRDDGLFGFWILVMTALLLGTFLAGACGDGPLPLGACLLGSPPIAVIGRVVIDTSTDPTSHSLWPLEVVLAGAMAVSAVAIGMALAWGIRRVAPSTSS